MNSGHVNCMFGGDALAGAADEKQGRALCVLPLISALCSRLRLKSEGKEGGGEWNRRGGEGYFCLAGEPNFNLVKKDLFLELRPWCSG